jgi:hypothetical protein
MCERRRDAGVEIGRIFDTNAFDPSSFGQRRKVRVIETRAEIDETTFVPAR